MEGTPLSEFERIEKERLDQQAEGIRKARRFMLMAEQDWLVLVLRDTHIPSMKLYTAVVSGEIERLRDLLKQHMVEIYREDVPPEGPEEMDRSTICRTRLRVLKDDKEIARRGFRFYVDEADRHVKVKHF